MIVVAANKFYAAIQRTRSHFGGKVKQSGNNCHRGSQRNKHVTTFPLLAINKALSASSGYIGF